MSNTQVVRLNTERLSVRVARCLREHGPQMTAAAINAILRESEPRLKAALYRLKRDGCVEQYGKYPGALWEFSRMPKACGLRPMTVKRGNHFVMPPAAKMSAATKPANLAVAPVPAKHVPVNPMATKRRPITELWDLCQRDPLATSQAAIWHYIR